MAPKHITERQQFVNKDYAEAFNKALIKVTGKHNDLKHVLTEYCQ